MNPMHRAKYKHLLIILLPLISGCANDERALLRQNRRGEYLIRNQNEYLFVPPSPVPREREIYPWEGKSVGGFPRITKEFFRCKGNPLNPVIVQKRGERETLYHRDCQGGHGLPLKNDQEFVYPTLIDLLNYIQEKREKRVVITSGHRCPIHNTYCDYTAYNWGSKHMLGAEVDFYVEGMESEPEKIIDLITAYYKEPFTRFTQGGLDVSTPPWYNQEIFIKLYLPHEGRNCDNQHPHPYIGVQVRYDKMEQKRITFSQEQAENYLRH